MLLRLGSFADSVGVPDSAVLPPRFLVKAPSSTHPRGGIPAFWPMVIKRVVRYDHRGPRRRQRSGPGPPSPTRGPGSAGAGAPCEPAFPTAPAARGQRPPLGGGGTLTRQGICSALFGRRPWPSGSGGCGRGERGVGQGGGCFSQRVVGGAASGPGLGNREDPGLLKHAPPLPVRDDAPIAESTPSARSLRRTARERLRLRVPSVRMLGCERAPRRPCLAATRRRSWPHWTGQGHRGPGWLPAVRPCHSMGSPRRRHPSRAQSAAGRRRPWLWVTGAHRSGSQERERETGRVKGREGWREGGMLG